MVKFSEETDFMPEICVDIECDNDCLFCAVGGEYSKRFPKKSLKDIKKELKELRTVGNNIRITGGEPTIRGDITEIVSYAKRLDFNQISIETNGRKLSNEKFLKKIMKAGANHFFVSIHGQNAKIHERVTRAPGSFKETIKGIENISKNKIHFGINVVITRFNYKHLPEIVRFLRKMTDGYITLNFITVHGSTLLSKKIVPPISETVPYIKRAINSLDNDNAISIGHISFCFLGDYINYSNFVRLPFVTKIVNPTFTLTLESHLDRAIQRSEKCKKCRFVKFCRGLWEEYAKIYGYGELKPVLGKRIETLEELKYVMDSAKGRG
ncbi:MAG: radical SAM protein [Candidatus Aenigmarchaeota archaeon]|nr:radical SAM protein [Candidatus Aenigmarchaeota archaeon]